MTSLKSLQNNFGYAYRTGLRGNSLVAVLNTAFLSLFYILFPVSTFFINTTTRDDSGKISQINFKKEYAFMFSTDMGIYRYLIIAALLGVGLLMGVMTFKFITGKKTVNVYYSLGIKRTKLFAARYLSGLTLIAASVLLPMLGSLIINIIKLGVNKYMIPAFFYMTLGMFSLAAFSYTLTALVCSLVGTVFEGGLFSFILIVFPEAFISSLQILISKLVFGTAYGYYFSSDYDTETLSSKYTSFNPLRYLSAGLYEYSQANADGSYTSYDTGSTVSWSFPNFLPIIIWLLVTGIIFAFGMFFYERRKAEIGGFIGKNKALNFIGVFIAGMYGFSLCVSGFYSVVDNVYLCALIGAAAFIVIYVILYMLLLRNMRLFAKSLYNLPIQLAVVALIFVFFSTGYFGKANEIPETAKIASAKITSVYGTYAYDGNTSSGYYMFDFTTPSSIPSGNYETENDIEFVRSLNQAIVDEGKQSARVMDDDYNGVAPVEVRILYTLKDGSTVKRRYYGITEETLKKLSQQSQTDYYKAQLKKLFKDEIKVVEQPDLSKIVYNTTSEYYSDYNVYKYIKALRESGEVRLYNKTLSAETVVSLSENQRQQLLDCLYEDLSSLTSEQTYNPSDTLGMIAFIDDSSSSGSVSIASATQEDEEEVIIEQNSSYDGLDEEFSGTNNSINDTSPSFYITSDMTKTVEFLKSVGYYDALNAEPKVNAVRIIKVSQMTSVYDDDYYQKYFVEQYEEVLPYEFTAKSQEYGFDMAGGASWDGNSSSTVYQSTDAQLISALSDAGKLRSTLSPDGYIVYFSFEGGLYSRVYVSGDVLSDSVKAEVEKNTISYY